MSEMLPVGHKYGLIARGIIFGAKNPLKIKSLKMTERQLFETISFYDPHAVHRDEGLFDWLVCNGPMPTDRELHLFGVKVKIVQ